MKPSITLCLIFVLSYLGAQIKVEPEFWWADMERQELQLLFYGENVSALELHASSPLRVNKVRRTENPNYLFVYLDVKDVEPGKVALELRNGKEEVVQNYEYEFKSRDKASKWREGFGSEDVIYLLMPDRFANGNPSNDSTDDTVEKHDRSNKDGRHGGDIQGIIDHLDYIKDLGATAIWSTPLLEDNEPHYSYHTYAQSDYYKIDPRYGTNADYKRLADELHKRDMKLIMDYVTNHWGSKHWMIKDLPTKDWIHIWENGEKGFRRSNYRMTTQFDHNASNSDSEGCMDGWFDTTMPDMNQKNDLLLDYMIQNAIWWVEFAGLDGFRVDTYSYNDKASIAEWTKAIMDEYPNFNIVGEVWMHDQAQISFWQKDSPIGAINNFNSHCPSVMDFTLHDAILAMFHEEEEHAWDRGMIRAYENFANDFLYSNVNNLFVFGGNHDTNRLAEEFDGDIDKYKLMMTLIATVRGIPQIYYGDEIGMRGNKFKLGDGDIRRDFPGGWKGDPRNAFQAEGRTEKENDYHNFTRKILNWRKSSKVVHHGKTTQFVPQNNVYVYFRHIEDEKVMVVINNSNKNQTVDLDRFRELLPEDQKVKEVLSDQPQYLGKTLDIGGKSSFIFEWNLD